MLDFARLATPQDHGATLVEPPADRLAEWVDENRRALAVRQASFAGIDLQTVRSGLRNNLAGDADAPVIVLGHQPEFIHAGVWAKHVVAVRLAAALGGSAINLVADHDTPKRTDLTFPVVEQGHVRLHRFHFFELPHDVTFESMPRVLVASIKRLEQGIRIAWGERLDETPFRVFVMGLQDSLSTGDGVDQMVHARRQVESTFGIELIDQKVSDHWVGPMTAAILADGPRFATAYNNALSDYRQAEGFRSSHHPMPDLLRREDRWELPFWTYRRHGTRRRLFVEYRADHLELFAGTEALRRMSRDDLSSWHTAEPALRSMNGYVLRPRAITLTLWARLLLADLFIHGIGGAKYDRITDRLIQEYYGFAPPAMACVSATLQMALPVHDVSDRRERELRHRLRDGYYNPRRHFDLTHETTVLLDRKQKNIDEVDGLRAVRPAPRARRRELFLDIHDLNERVAAMHVEQRRAWGAERIRVQELLRENAVVSNREYFFALHSRTDLELLMSRLPVWK